MKSEKVIKLCFIVPKVYPLFNQNIKAISGGAEKQVYLLGKELSKNKKYEINYCVSDYGQKKFEKYGNINIYNTFSFKDNIFVSLKNILKQVKNINPDCCIFRGDDKKIFILALIIKFFLKIKYVFWISHDNLVRKKSFFNYILFKNAFKVIAQTNDQKKLLKKNYPVNSVVIRNIFVKGDNKIETNIKKNIILWVGRSEKWKRPEIFLELANKNTGEKFVMVMSAATNKEKYFNKIKELAEKQKNLMFLSNLKFDDIIKYYKESKLFVITSKEEGFSNTMMEAMEYSCPILSLKVNPDNIIDEYKLGFCAHDDIDKFYEYFYQLNSDNHLRKKMSTNAQEYLKINHGTEIILKKTIELVSSK